MLDGRRSLRWEFIKEKSRRWVRTKPIKGARNQENANETIRKVKKKVSRELLIYWWCNFPMNPHVCRLAGWAVGQSICHNFLERSGNSMLLSEPLLYLSCLTKPTLGLCIPSFFKALTFTGQTNSSKREALGERLRLLDAQHLYNRPLPPSRPRSVPLSLFGPYLAELFDTGYFL